MKPPLTRTISPPTDHGVAEQRASQEHLLYEYVQRLDKHHDGRIGLHIHLSRLQSHNRRDHHIRVATSTFEDLVKQFDGRIFTLMNSDLIFICRNASLAALDEVVMKLRYLFSEDPLTRFGDEDSSGGFSTWYRLEEDYSRLLSLAKKVHDLSQAHRQERKRVKQAAEAGVKELLPLTPALLGKMVEALSRADLSSLVRNQPVCAIAKRNEPPQPIFREMYVSIGELESALLTNVSLTSDPWLFKYLTQTLDRRMLTQVLRDNHGMDEAFSLNLNVSTILAPDFHIFDQGVSINVRGRLVVELQKEDIFADMGAYHFARDYLRERGYRICLDGMTHLTLPFIDRERLGIDLIKLFWSSELADPMKEELVQELAERVAKTGKSRVILARCDQPEAIEIGRRMGISLFQGRYIDRLYQKSRPASERMGSIRLK